MTDARPHVVVLGAGISGLVTAWELARKGVQVTVLEAAPFVGGRTSSWTDADGHTVDTGLHVVADHYVNLLQVMEQTGAPPLEWVREHLYLRPGNAPLKWKFNQRRSPFHLQYPAQHMPVTLVERARLSVAGIEAARMTQADLASLDHLTYREWHDRHRLGDGFLREMAEAASDAATFLSIEEASARAVLSWMKYLTRDSSAGDVGIFRGSMADCLTTPLVRAIENLGGRVLCSTGVVGLQMEGQRVRAVMVDETVTAGPCHWASGEVQARGYPRALQCDHVVSTLPPPALRRVLTGAQADAAGLDEAVSLGVSPALSVILWFDRRIHPTPAGAPLVSGCVMRDFIDLRTVGRQPQGFEGSVYQFVLCRAGERIHHDDAKVVADLARDLGRVWPGARVAKVVHHAIERIEASMFAAVPGAHRKRPHARTRVPNLFMAGDWTRHELNSSMEGAAYSGRRAAELVLRAEGRPAELVRSVDEPWITKAMRRMPRWGSARAARERAA